MSTLAYLPLDGNTIDYSGITWNLSGSITWESRNPLTEDGKSLHFNGGRDFLECPEMANLFNQIGTNDFTLEYWLYHTSNYHMAAIFSTRISVNDCGNLGCYMRDDKIAITLSNYNGGRGNYTFSTSYTLGPFIYNQWNHFAISKNNGVFRIFLNGTSIWETSTTSNLNGNIFRAPFHIGNRQSEQYYSYLSDGENSMAHFRLSDVGLYATTFDPLEQDWKYVPKNKGNILKVY